MNVTTMSAKKLEKESEKTDKAFWDVVGELIAVGRGMDRPSDIFPRTDPLSIKYTELFEKNMELGAEYTRRMDHHGSLKPIK